MADVLVDTTYTITDKSTKLGVVYVLDAQGAIIRTHRITADEAEKIRTVNNFIPSACTPEEWFSGRVFSGTICVDVGDAVQADDGSLFICVASKQIDADNYVHSISLIPASDWASNGKNLKIKSSVKASIDTLALQVEAATSVLDAQPIKAQVVV